MRAPISVTWSSSQGGILPQGSPDVIPAAPPPPHCSPPPGPHGLFPVAPRGESATRCPARRSGGAAEGRAGTGLCGALGLRSPLGRAGHGPRETGRAAWRSSCPASVAGSRRTKRPPTARSLTERGGGRRRFCAAAPRSKVPGQLRRSFPPRGGVLGEGMLIVSPRRRCAFMGNGRPTASPPAALGAEPARRLCRWEGAGPPC